MRIKIFCTLVLFAFFTNVFGQKTETNGKTNLEKKVATYFIKLTKAIFYNSIEFGERKKFDIEQLIKDHKVPEIFKDDPQAIKLNEDAFERLETYSNEVGIGYSVSLTFGLKEKETDPWEPSWVIVLLDNDLKIVGHTFYWP